MWKISAHLNFFLCLPSIHRKKLKYHHGFFFFSFMSQFFPRRLNFILFLTFNKCLFASSELLFFSSSPTDAVAKYLKSYRDWSVHLKKKIVEILNRELSISSSLYMFSFTLYMILTFICISVDKSKWVGGVEERVEK